MKYTSEYYLQKAEQNTPPLFYSTAQAEKTVRIEEDSNAFFGYAATPAGAPPEVVRTGDSFVLDFERHCVGRLSFRVWDDGRYIDAPVRLKLKFGEVPYEIARDHSTYHGSLCPSWLTEEIINVDMIGTVSLPRRYSFRYLEVTVVATPRPTRLSEFTVVCETSADESKLTPLPAGTDSQLVEIDRVAAATLRDCMQSAYEDGPKRDRRLWSGDLYLQALTDQVLFDNSMLARRCLYLFAACEEENRYLPGCLYQYPTLSFDYEMDISDYAMLFCTALADYYAHTKDAETAKDLFPVVKRQMQISIDSMDENGVITPPKSWNGGFIDWAPKLQHITPVQGVMLYALRRLIPLAEALGETETATLWKQSAARATKAAQTVLFSKEKDAFVNAYDQHQYSVQAQAWMILGGVIGGEDGKRVLTKALQSADSVKPVTPYMNHYLVAAMLELGMKDEALAHIKGYWGEMVKHGADTFWEVFVKGQPDVSPYNDVSMHSFCHAWSCSASYFIRKYFLA